MGRLLILVLAAIAVMVAYPWVGGGFGVALVVALIVARSAGGRRRTQSIPTTPYIPLERRAALRAAYREIHAIEAAHGIPPTPSGL